MLCTTRRPGPADPGPGAGMQAFDKADAKASGVRALM